MATFKDLFIEDDKIKLPIGVEIDGTTYDTVTISEITGYAEEAMGSKAIGNNWGKMITALLKATIVSVEGYTGDLLRFIKGLSIGERDILFLAVRYVTYGNVIEGESKCRNCGKEVNYTIDLDELELQHEGARSVTRTFELPSGLKIRKPDGTVKVLRKGTIRNATGDDQEHTYSLLEKNPALWKTAMLQRIVVDIEGEEFTTIHSKSLSKKDRDYLMVLGNEYEQAPDSDTLVCPHCGEVTEVPVLNPGFFR